MSRAPIAIAGRSIGPGQPPYVIAEMSGNHNGDIGRALNMNTNIQRVFHQMYMAVAR